MFSRPELMIKSIEKILFNSVLVVILLHTFIPHPHSEEMTDEQHIDFHKNSNTLFELIAFVFHENNDEGLDNLLVAKYDNVLRNKITYQNSTTAALYGTFSTIEKTSVEKIAQRNTNNFHKILIVKLNGERGPPFKA